MTFGLHISISVYSTKYFTNGSTYKTQQRHAKAIFLTHLVQHKQATTQSVVDSIMLHQLNFTTHSVYIYSIYNSMRTHIDGDLADSKQSQNTLPVVTQYENNSNNLCWHSRLNSTYRMLENFVSFPSPMALSTWTRFDAILRFFNTASQLIRFFLLKRLGMFTVTPFGRNRSSTLKPLSAIISSPWSQRLSKLDRSTACLSLVAPP